MKSHPEAPPLRTPYPPKGEAVRRASPWLALIRRKKLRFLALFAGIVYFLYCAILSKPLFAHPLPQHTGPYAVGTVDIEAPVSPPRIIDPAVFKGTSDPAFELQTVLFSLYYPTTYVKGHQSHSQHAKRHTWIPPPVSLRAQGYARAAHISNWFTNTLFSVAIRALVGSITIPASVDAPLSDHASREAKFATSWDKAASELEVLASDTSGHPVIVFSHGTVSSRTDYSHYAGELAARGYIVVMLEHRDGSGPGSEIMRKGYPTTTRLLFDEKAVTTPKGEALSIEDFHKAQLNFREAEMEEAVRIMKMINNGQGDAVFEQNPRGEGRDLAFWAGRLNTDEMIVSGHSYGATGALQALRGGPSEKRPFKGGLILDPGKSSGPLNEDIRVPLLVVHSNTWSSHTSLFYGGRAHFDTVKDLVVKNNERGNPSWFMTSLGTSHPSITDAPLLEPFLLSFTTGASIDVYQGLRQYVHIAEDFLGFLGDGKKRGLLKEEAAFPQYDPGSGLGIWKPGQGDDEKAWEEKGEWWDWRSYWQIHVSAAGEKEI
ncbi:platelet-activating factor acetylhydrolase, isoform II-domain-containing protein [Podospora australis]|uniref:Putative phospholipase n=1 Tax=Podospora australis TaxID=1536484 RepID=A0AAN7AI28_9PEZI|nr:platelet-activating factor acetylhydrolase, isoform II-domain-containing protein [Podospora australis]